MKRLVNVSFVLVFTLLISDLSFSQNRISIQQGTVAFKNVYLDVAPLFPDWISGVVDSIPFVFYNLKGDSTLYLYEIKIQGKYAGYFTTGAYDDLPVHIEATDALPPQSNSGNCKKKLAEILRVDDDKVVLSQFLSPGEHFYYVKFSTPKRNYFMDLKSLKIVDIKYLSALETDIEKYRENNRCLLHRKWDETLTARLKKATGSSKILDGVEAYEWYRGCTPTSLTMVLNYHGKDPVFSGLRHSAYSFNWNGPSDDPVSNPRYNAKALADDFADYFGLRQSGGKVDDYSVSYYDHPDGVVYVANSHGYEFGSSLILTFNSSHLKYEIDNDRPIKYGIPGHSQCGFGYASNGNTIYYYNSTLSIYAA